MIDGRPRWSTATTVTESSPDCVASATAADAAVVISALPVSVGGASAGAVGAAAAGAAAARAVWVGTVQADLTGKVVVVTGGGAGGGGTHAATSRVPAPATAASAALR